MTNTGNTAVIWSLSPSVGSISSSGLYTAPTPITADQTIAVIATSVADSTKSGSSSALLTSAIGIFLDGNPQIFLYANQSVQYTASVTNTTNMAVTWSINPNVGAISSSGLYTAPSSVGGSGQNITVTATSVADPTRSASRIVTLTPPLAVSISPASTALLANQTQQFSVTLTNAVQSRAVTWTISPTTGTVSSSGLYTAPSSIASQRTVRITATSVADTTKSASATITLLAHPIVSVTPNTVNLWSGQTQTFTASVQGTANQNVTWVLSPQTGSIAADGTYTAPQPVTSRQSINALAFSVVDGAAVGGGTAIIEPVGVFFSPASTTLYASQTQQFSVSVTGASDTTVIWSLNPQVGAISSSGLYTAPASITAQQTITVTAASNADNSRAGSGVVILSPPTPFTVSPNTASLYDAQTQQYTSSNPNVSWSINPSAGTISATGLYAAPFGIGPLQTVSVTATDNTDSTKSVSVTVNLQPFITVSASPSGINLGPGQSQQFTATAYNTIDPSVTWSMSPQAGTLTANGLYTAPATISATRTIQLTATSVTLKLTPSP